MPRVCTVCTHSERPAIDRALVSRRPFRHLSAQFGLSTGALVRHSDEHLPHALSRAQEAAEVARADDLLEQVREVKGRALGILNKAETAGDYRGAVGALREMRGCIELLAKLLGDLDEGPVVNLTISAEWLDVRATLLAALADYPEARQTVAARLVALEGRGGARGAS